MSGLKEINGKVAVVTGGASGIGKGIAKQLIANGARVIIADIEQAALERTAAEIGATPIQTDVTNADSGMRLARAARELYGTVHIVCNNAGVGPVSRIEDMSLEDWRWILDVNVWGVIHGVHTFLPILKANEEGGHFVNTSSLGGLATMPTMAAYSVTKFAVGALSETLAQELAAEGSRVGVTLLLPGTVRTNIARSSRNRPAGPGRGGFMDVDLQKTEEAVHLRWLEPEQVGDIVVEAIRNGDLYAFTHPEMTGPIEERHQRISQAIRDAAARS